jgi:1-acyl-sn-glycerol-3-phosphate acyltransferase
MLIWALGIPVAAITLALLAGAVAAQRLRDPTDPVTGFLYCLGRLYARLVHNLEVETEPGALTDLDGPLLVVCNHTAGVDPILVSSGCPRRIAWIMAEDMRIPVLNWFWRWQRVIFVTRNSEGRKGMRDARSALAAGGCIGIFPEGRLERPHGRLLPFNSGVGVLVRRTNARVLPVIIEGTPQTESAWSALWTPVAGEGPLHAADLLRRLNPDPGRDRRGPAAPLRRLDRLARGHPRPRAARIKSKAPPPAEITGDRSIA